MRIRSIDYQNWLYAIFIDEPRQLKEQKLVYIKADKQLWYVIYLNNLIVQQWVVALVELRCSHAVVGHAAALAADIWIVAITGYVDHGEDLFDVVYLIQGIFSIFYDTTIVNYLVLVRFFSIFFSIIVQISWYRLAAKGNYQLVIASKCRILSLILLILAPLHWHLRVAWFLISWVVWGPELAAANRRTLSRLPLEVRHHGSHRGRTSSHLRLATSHLRLMLLLAPIILRLISSRFLLLLLLLLQLNLLLLRPYACLITLQIRPFNEFTQNNIWTNPQLEVRHLRLELIGYILIDLSLRLRLKALIQALINVFLEILLVILITFQMMCQLTIF